MSLDVVATMRAGWDGRLPPRYDTDLHDRRFRRELRPLLTPGLDVLDLGSGASPAIQPDERPADCRYVALDISRAELDKAGASAYDETVVADARERVASLEGRFDLVVSFMTFEHVRPLDRVLENVRAYLRPHGRLFAQTAGRYSLFSLAGRLVPTGLARKLLHRAHGRALDATFPAYYDQCWYSALARLLGDWDEVSIAPLYTAAGYVTFSRLLTAAYLPYEEWVRRSGRLNLAPYYLLSARAPKSAFTAAAP